MSKKKKNYRSPELKGYSLSRESYASSSGKNEGGTTSNDIDDF